MKFKLFLIILMIVPSASNARIHEWRPNVAECTPFTFNCIKCKEECTFYVMDANFTQATLCWPGYMNPPMRQFALAKFKKNDTCPDLPNPPTTIIVPDSTTDNPIKEEDASVLIIGIIAAAVTIIIVLGIAFCYWRKRTDTFHVQYRTNA